jgi:dolichyl-phosphate-mannose--protein O-mannosyl transferase
MTSGVLIDLDTGTGDPERSSGTPSGERVPDAVRRRLTPMAGRDPMSWLVTGVVTAVAGAIRLVGVTHPRGKIFDEIYYATEGHELYQHGVEWRPESNSGDFVVHPPLGKWLIGLGETGRLFGQTELGWRIAAVVAGTLSVLITVRLARRMFGSNVLGGAAGLLMALDGMHFVLSRSALLDIFLLFFVLASFACLVVDRDQRRARWLAAMEAGLDPRVAVPRPGVPWWRLAGGVLIGCACAVKWSGLWYLIAFAILILAWEIGLRRTVRSPHPWIDGFVRESGWIAAFVGVAVLAYLASWTGWFVTDSGWDRHWLASHGHSEWPIVGPLVNLWQYHREAYQFHVGLNQHHTYQSWPWQWLLLGRPVAFYWSGDGPCSGPTCASEVLLLGTPVLWWSFLPALVTLGWLGVARRDWRAAAILVGALVGIVPWFQYELDDRTMFYFYAAPAEPFLVLAVVYVLGVLIGPAPVRGEALPDRRLIGTVIAGIFVGAVAICFVYFYPIYTGKVITYAEWWARMWLGSRWV